MASRITWIIEKWERIGVFNHKKSETHVKVTKEPQVVHKGASTSAMTSSIMLSDETPAKIKLTASKSLP